MSNNDFTDRVALVTGGSRGIGRAIALQLAREGADVAISYASRPGPAESAQSQIKALGRHALALQCNVASQDDVDKLAARTRETLGPVDLLVHCAGVLMPASAR